MAPDPRAAEQRHVRIGDTQNADALRDLGSAVRERRRALGLTLNDVAERTGLSGPFLSQIETSFATPSLTSLFAVARVLDTTPERLLAGPPPAEIVLTRKGEGRRYDVTDAARSAQRRQLTGIAEPFSTAEYVVEPGTDLGDFNASEGRELIFVTGGRLIVDIRINSGAGTGMGDGELTSHELSAGDSLIYSTSSQHRWRHVGRATTRFIHVVSN
jgi:transcriptional regulator with XRE-family HTH domain